MTKDVPFTTLLAQDYWFSRGSGPRYRQLARHLKETITSGVLAADALLPPERDMAEQAGVSRVTIRKAIAELAGQGLLRQRQGSGTYVEAAPRPQLTQSLSSLVSFSETMARRGYSASSRVLEEGFHPASPAETVALGLDAGARVARVRRLRMADPGPLALETSTLPEDVLPDPGAVDQSLYAVLRATGHAPVRALQRVRAVNLNAPEAELMGVERGTAFLQIERTGYLANGRPVEFTVGVYRSDIYDFLAEVRLEDG